MPASGRRTFEEASSPSLQSSGGSALKGFEFRSAQKGQKRGTLLTSLSYFARGMQHACRILHFTSKKGTFCAWVRHGSNFLVPGDLILLPGKRTEGAFFQSSGRALRIPRAADLLGNLLSARARRVGGAICALFVRFSARQYLRVVVSAGLKRKDAAVLSRRRPRHVAPAPGG